MTDNTILPGTGETYAAKDRGGIKHQVVLTEVNGRGSDTDAFGRLRVSNTVTLFASKLIYSDKQTLFWDEALETGSGITGSTPTAAKPYIDFQSTLSTAGKYTRQTFRRFNHQPGKSQTLSVSGVLQLSGGGTGVVRRIGYFDDDNGLFFEDSNNVMGVVVRSNVTGSPVDSRVEQANWNLDNLDGGDDAANPSGILADWTKTHIFVTDFQWLAVGRIRFGVVVDGRTIYVHEVNTANVEVEPWSSTPNVPVRMQMVTTASSPASSMRVIGVSLLAEGGPDFVGITHSHATTDHINANTADTWYALLGLRLKTTHLGSQLQMHEVSVVAETNDKFEWAVMHNPTVAGTFTYSDHADSASSVQEATGDSVTTAGGGCTNTVTGGNVLLRGFGSSASAVSVVVNSAVGLGAAIDGTRDTVVLAVRPLASNADVQGSLTWLEQV